MFRPALQRRLERALRHRLTSVVAGEGFGKSTTVAAWAAGDEHAWYTVDDEDAHLGSLVDGIVAALWGARPELPASTLGQLAVGSADDVVRAETMAGLLADALREAADPDLLLVVDDVHEMGRGPAAAFLGAHSLLASPTLHLVLISREVRV